MKGDDYGGEEDEPGPARVGNAGRQEGHRAQRTAAPAAAGENPYTQWYEVKKGDTLWKIAKEHYGDGNLYPEIFKANQDVLSDPDKIQVGQKLRIP